MAQFWGGTSIWALALGGLVGILSGLIGVGGGIILIPALVYMVGMGQHMAQGTSLAMLLPPTGVLAFLEYYKAGKVNWQLGLIIAGGVVLGGYFGLALHLGIKLSFVTALTK
jgi:uncharacterized membrane protein YfcA